jgi:SAM-dependent methyltransferase
MFHELPPKVRREAFREFGRLLKPGGRLVIVDSLQLGDEPAYDGMLERFPQNYHGPLPSYLRGLPECRRVWLTHLRDLNAFISKGGVRQATTGERADLISRQNRDYSQKSGRNIAVVVPVTQHCAMLQ